MKKEIFPVKLKLESYSFLKKDVDILLNIPEANIYETLEFMEKMDNPDFELIELIFNLFEKSSTVKINKKKFAKYFSNNLETILEILKKTYIKGVFNPEIEEKIEKNQEKPKKISSKKFDRDLARLIAFLTTRMPLDPDSLMTRYTWRGLIYWSKHYLYNEREKTEEGRKENKKEENKLYVEENKDELKQSFETINNYLNRKKS